MAKELMAVVNDVVVPVFEKMLLLRLPYKPKEMILPPTKSYIGKRIAATLIDYTIVFGLTFVYIYVAGEPNEEGGYTVTGLAALAPLLGWFLYFIVAEAAFGGTIGHQLFDLKVVSTDGNDPTFSQTIRRRLADVLEISWCFGLIAFILVKSTAHNQRLGDTWAKTIVIGKKDTFPQPQFEFETNI
jgi:uncharacterized RDD family membrane protein YckC